MSDDIIQFLNTSAGYYYIGHLIHYLEEKGITFDNVTEVYKKVG